MPLVSLAAKLSTIHTSDRINDSCRDDNIIAHNAIMAWTIGVLHWRLRQAGGNGRPDSVISCRLLCLLTVCEAVSRHPDRLSLSIVAPAPSHLPTGSTSASASPSVPNLAERGGREPLALRACDAAGAGRTILSRTLGPIFLCRVV